MAALAPVIMSFHSLQRLEAREVAIVFRVYSSPVSLCVQQDHLSQPPLICLFVQTDVTRQP